MIVAEEVRAVVAAVAVDVFDRDSTTSCVVVAVASMVASFVNLMVMACSSEDDVIDDDRA